MKRRNFLAACSLGSVSLPWAIGNTVASGQPLSDAALSLTAQRDSAEFQAPRISLISCGGAGRALCRDISPSVMGIHQHWVLDSSPRALRASGPDSRTLLLGAGVQKPKSVEAAWQATHQHGGEIAGFIRDSDLVIIAAGLGGATGSGAALALSEMAATSGIPSLLIATQPFGFEDALRQARARQVLDALTQARRHLLKIDLNALSTARNQESTLADGLAVAREAFTQALSHSASRWQQDRLIATDFADFLQLLGSGNEARIGSVGWGEAQGPNRAEQASWLALHHPLLRQTLRESEHLSGISVTIRSAQGNLRLAEVQAVMQALRAHCGEDVLMLFETDAHPRIGERLQVSLWAMRNQV
jgi:cell division protein FtsZ